MKRVGKQTWVFDEEIYIRAAATAVGPLEADGPLGRYFDISYRDLYCGEETWELAERRLMSEAVARCLQKAGISARDVDLFLAGDLLNQNATSNYVARGMPIPFLCLFGACSTSMQTLAAAAALVGGGLADTALVATSSHNATAERQFRYPTELGVQKPKTATFTVTGAGAALVGRIPGRWRIRAATIGKVIDAGVTNPLDMGAAMAPAAADTIERHFRDLGASPRDYDLIVTGDLSRVGSVIVCELLAESGYDISDVYNDCGLMIYRPDQKVFAGGSGCACSAVVTYGYLLNELDRGTFRRLFVVATGALLSQTMVQQKQSIPAVAHGVVIEAAKREPDSPP
ncbi:stage V sporulation protein AD [Geobacillus sp. 46C-IIa]|uniref:stage V sporulation protein AD n=1 Tax=Geobacillus sp. 46C-IIa TaxID=1963025 RepID=UPI0009BCE24B|nr:stage V sporulation protein AD [Geobacillus sp. 46C-IIa]OQP06013.1 stage V sporulation protein AD [Geobacillus sp. 46C-IIa]QNU28973.1 stage V sporulation protein AD [Geobacillus sp. 46C-IIa]